MMYYIELGFNFAPYVFLTVSVYKSLRAEDNQEKIIHLLWAIIFVVIAVADEVSK
jgi:hypothetical protein